MFSINYSHVGEGKFWYFVSEDNVEKFDTAIKSHYQEIFAKKPYVLHDVNLQMNPLDLIKYNVYI